MDISSGYFKIMKAALGGGSPIKLVSMMWEDRLPEYFIDTSAASFSSMFVQDDPSANQFATANQKAV